MAQACNSRELTAECVAAEGQHSSSVARHLQHHRHTERERRHSVTRHLQKHKQNSKRDANLQACNQLKRTPAEYVRSQSVNHQHKNYNDNSAPHSGDQVGRHAPQQVQEQRLCTQPFITEDTACGEATTQNQLQQRMLQKRKSCAVSAHLLDLHVWVVGLRQGGCIIPAAAAAAAETITK